jgi:hypothetical protein
MISKLWTISLLLVRIRIPNKDPDDHQESQINTDPDPKHCEKPKIDFYYQYGISNESAVLRIHDILMLIRIRIWIRGSFPRPRLMDPDSHPDPDPGGQKTYRSDGSGSATLLVR